MAVTGKRRGHPVWYMDTGWVYVDTGSAVSGDERACGHCGRENTPEGHDPCLGMLPGVANACCGHGEEAEMYVMFESGDTIRGSRATGWVGAIRGVSVMGEDLNI